MAPAHHSRMFRDGTRLLRAERISRMAALLAAMAVAVGLALLDPSATALNRFTCPFLAITGLPCPFCGLTRATHHLLNGDWSRSWSLNPLAFPIALILLALAGRTIVEVATGRRARPILSLNAAGAMVLAAIIVIHWTIRIQRAVTGPCATALQSVKANPPIRSVDGRTESTGADEGR